MLFSSLFWRACPGAKARSAGQARSGCVRGDCVVSFGQEKGTYPDSSLADLYDELTMPPELRKAHQQNDRAVMEAYGMPVKGTTESSCVAELMRRYQQLTAGDQSPKE